MIDTEIKIMPGGTVDGSLTDLSNQLTLCSGCAGLGVFSCFTNCEDFWRGDNLVAVYFPRISCDLTIELTAYTQRKRDPSPQLKAMIEARAILVRQALGDNVGDEF